MVDCPVFAPVKDMLLTAKNHCRGVTRGRGRSGFVSPSIETVRLMRSVPQNMVDRSIQASIEDMLLIAEDHRDGITGCWRSVGFVSPSIETETIIGGVPHDMVDCAVDASVKNVLLIAESHRGRVARCRRCIDSIGPLIKTKSASRNVPKNVVDCSIFVAVKDMLLAWWYYHFAYSDMRMNRAAQRDRRQKRISFHVVPRKRGRGSSITSNLHRRVGLCNGVRRTARLADYPSQ
jgi:hypothetical protein